jgi:hypothetical protein
LQNTLQLKAGYIDPHANELADEARGNAVRSRDTLRKEVAPAMTQKKRNRVRERWAQRGFSPADLLNLRPI